MRHMILLAMTSWKYSIPMLMALIAGMMGLCLKNIQAQIVTKAAEKAIATQDDPRQMLLTEPQTPVEFFRAARLMVEYGQPQIAKDYLQGLSNSKPSDEQLLEITNIYGASELLRLGNSNELQPEGGMVLNLINAALVRQANDPQYIDRIIDGLSGSVNERDMAIQQLRSLELNALPRLLIRYQTGANEERDLIAFTLVSMGQPIIPGLIAALETQDNVLKSTVLTVLGWINAQQVRPDIGYLMLSPREDSGVRATAADAWQRLDEFQKLSSSTGLTQQIDPALMGQFLYQQGKDDFCVRKSWPVDTNGNTTVWMWDDQQSTIAPISLTPARASLQMAFRSARRALVLLPHARDVQALLMGIQFAITAREQDYAGYDPANPVSHLGLVVGEQLLMETLNICLDCGQSSAAIMALDALSRVGTLPVVTQGTGTAIHKALNSNSSRIQLAAADAVLRLRPRQPFTHTQRVTQILKQGINSVVPGAIVVIDPNTGRGQTMTGMMNELSYPGQLVHTGKEGFELAATRGDLAAIMIHASCIDWPLSATIANLKADRRTSYVPILIYGPLSVESDIQYLIDQFPLVDFLITTEDLGSLRTQLVKTFAKLGLAPLTASEQNNRFQMSLDWVSRLADGYAPGVFDLTAFESALQSRLYDDQTQVQVMQVLARIPTATAQSELAEVALLEQIPGERRVMAMTLLCQHVREFGLLLSMEKIDALKSLYRQTPQDELRIWLSTFLGMLRPNDVLSGERMLQLFAP